jgi:hypothetical protein
MKSFRFSGRAAVICCLILAIGVPSAALGFGEGRSLLMGKRNPSSSTSRALNSETEIIANTSTYGTRQSNKRDGDGGGAIYGCRSNPGKEPCVRANNLKGGRAFEFSTVGKEAGEITVGDQSGAPFTTNATGVATGLNSDKVDGKDATDFAPSADFLFALVNDPGSGALTIAGRGPTAATQDGDIYTVTFNRDISKCSFTASPVGAVAQPLAVSSVPNQPTQIAVSKNTDGVAGTPTPTDDPDTSFYLQVIC